MINFAAHPFIFLLFDCLEKGHYVKSAAYHDCYYYPIALAQLLPNFRANFIFIV